MRHNPNKKYKITHKQTGKTETFTGSSIGKLLMRLEQINSSESGFYSDTYNFIKDSYTITYNSVSVLDQIKTFIENYEA